MFDIKYWYPAMNSMMDELIGECCECQVTKRQHIEQLIKPSVIPDKPWEEISIDFGGPYPNGHYNLIVVDKRTRYLEVEKVPSTSFKPTQANLKQRFSHQVIPQYTDSDRGVPFNLNSHILLKWRDLYTIESYLNTQEPMEKQKGSCNC